MINVVYDRKAHKLTMTGHAQAAAHGNDIVCAAASILCYTFANTAEYYAGKGMYAKAVLSSGNAEIVCSVAEECRAEADIAFDAICAGFALLVSEHPKNISYEVRG